MKIAGLLSVTAVLIFSVGSSKAEVILTPVIDLLLNSESSFEKLLRNYNNGVVSDYVYIAAHRGGKENDVADQAPGNSIANIDNAIANGFDIYESDIEILLGGDEETLIVFHDNDFNQLTNSMVADDLLDHATLAYAKSLKLTYDNGTVSDQQIPTLEEFLLAIKGKIIAKFDLKSGVFTTNRLSAIFDLIEQTGTVDQVLIRGGQYLLDTAFDNGYDAAMIMRRYDTEPSALELTNLKNTYGVKAISVPDGVSQSTITTANSLGLIVEIHDPSAATDMERQAAWISAIDLGVRQFHSFKPLQLKAVILDSNRQLD